MAFEIKIQDGGCHEASKVILGYVKFDVPEIKNDCRILRKI